MQHDKGSKQHVAVSLFGLHVHLLAKIQGLKRSTHVLVPVVRVRTFRRTTLELVRTPTPHTSIASHEQKRRSEEAKAKKRESATKFSSTLH